MKLFFVAVVAIIAYYIYRTMNPSATGNTSQDANKNLTIADPVAAGKVIQTGGGSASQSTTASASTPSAPVPATAKLYQTNVSTINPTYMFRGDVVNNDVISKAPPIGPIGVDWMNPVVAVDGPMYGNNLPDASLQLQVPRPVMQTAPVVPIAARTTDNNIIQPTSYIDEPMIPIDPRLTLDRGFALN